MCKRLLHALVDDTLKHVEPTVVSTKKLSHV